MATERVIVAAAAAMTAIGLSVAETAASLRAGLKRHAACAWRDAQGEPMIVARVPMEQDPDATGSPRERRLASLLRPTLAPVLRYPDRWLGFFGFIHLGAPNAGPPVPHIGPHFDR